MTDAQWKVLNAMKDRGAAAVQHNGHLVWAATIRADKETAQEILDAGYLDET